MEFLKKIIRIFKPVKNHGVLKRNASVTDYSVGNSPIDFVTRIYDGDWFEHLPENESQQRYPVETMSCVSFSALNTLEMQLNWMINSKNISINAYNFLLDNGYIENDKVNFSDRFTAIMSETMPTGNYLTKVADSIRHDGLIPEREFPFGDPKTWEEYHDKTKITQEMIDLGKRFLEHFVIQYEWVIAPGSRMDDATKRERILKHLKQAPLQMANNVHALSIYDGEENTQWDIYDSYEKFLKTKPWSYVPPYVMKVLVTERSPYSKEQVEKAREKILDVMRDRKAPYFQRVNDLGQVYAVNDNGSFYYLLGKKCPLFDDLSRKEYFTPISEELWSEFKPGEIK